MRTFRTVGIILAVAIAAVGLAVLPSIEEAPSARPGIVVGAQHAGASDGGGAGAALPGDVPESSDLPGAVALPRASGSGGQADGTHPDGDPSAMEYDPSPRPAPAPTSAPRSPAEAESSSSSSSSSGSAASGDSSPPAAPKAPKKPTAPQKPAGTCEWDDDGWECDDGGDDDDEDDGDDDD